MPGILPLLAALSMQPSSDLAHFDFRGLTTQTTEQQAVMAGTVGSCHKFFADVRECGLTDHSIGGTSSFMPTANFRGGTLVSISAYIPQDQFDQLKAALDERYGPPCLTDPSQSRFLKVGREHFWCFIDGAIRLDQFGHDGMSEFSFYARSYDDILADLQPKRDF